MQKMPPNDIWCEILSRLDNQSIVNMRVNKHMAALAPTCVFQLDLDKNPAADGRHLPNISTLIASHMSSLKHFSNVTDLNISRCDLINISRMTKLKILNISHNYEVCNEDITGLTNLTTLDMFGTNISDAGIQMLTNLTNLEIGSRGISNHGLRNLTKLQSLLACESAITDVSYLPQLKELYLNGDSRICDENMRKLTNLTLLNISSNKTITDAGIFGLNLRVLKLCNNKTITNKGLRGITSLVSLNACNSCVSFVPVSLTELDARYSDITVECLHGLTDLTTLAIDMQKDKVVSVLTTLTNLTKLSLSGVVCDEDFLRKLTYIHSLDLHGATYWSTDHSWDFSHMTKLNTLYLSPSMTFTGTQPCTRILRHKSRKLSLLPY
mgnify:FL=1